MPGMSDYSSGNWLAYITGKTAMPTLPVAFLGLYTVAPTADAGTGGTEVSTNAYARVTTAGADWNAPTASVGTEPSVVPGFTSNSATKSFPTATSSGWGTVVAWGMFDSSTAGNLLAFDYLGNFSWLPATISSASPGVITSKAHGYANGDLVYVTTKYGGVLPSFSASNLTGQLVVANSTTDTFTVTNAATAVNTSSTGDFMVRKIAAQSIPGGITASFAGGTPGALVLTAA